MQVGGLDWGEDGAAVVGGGDLRLALEVTFQIIGEYHPFSPSRSCSEDVVYFAEVEASRHDDKVEVM
jgi:hypothetical protein